MRDFGSFFEKIGIALKDIRLLEEAFTHRSAVNENPKIKYHNERLEFLGDAVLELVVTDFLFKKFNSSPEGELTNLRSSLVKGEHLASVARKLEMGKFLLLSKGEARSGGAEKEYLLANLVEAFIGALYLEKGLDGAKKFIEEFILSDLERIMETRDYIDAKSEFQELAQGELGITPHYEVIQEFGLDHDKTFVVEAIIEGKCVGKGRGRSKKEAQVEAAQDALSKKKEWLSN